jgi:hypothetical protein
MGPPAPEVNPFVMTRFNNALVIRHIDMELLRSTYWAFYDATDRRDIRDILARSPLTVEQLQQLNLEAEDRIMRFSTLIMFILRGFPLLNDSD